MIDVVAIVVFGVSSFGVGWISSYLYHTRNDDNIEADEITMNSDIGGMV